MSWKEAQSYCQENYSDLFTVKNRDVNLQLTETIQQYPCAWIGLFRDSWKWSDQTSLDSPLPWAEGQPDNAFDNEICGAVDDGAQVTDERCSRQLFFFCSDKVKCFYFRAFCGCFWVLIISFFSHKIQTSCMKMVGHVYN